MKRRILIVDDNRAIHEDFRKVLTPTKSAHASLSALEDALFGDASISEEAVDVELTSAYQGREAFELLQQAEISGRPFAMAFVDVRMPPGWDGVETVTHLWSVSPRLPVVICTAFSDYSWDQMIERLGHGKPLEILRKPFEPAEVEELVAKLANPPI